ncbi:MAG: Dabb family protein [Desulfobacterales bacterium]|nr:Dabb family protein [Desulfobacterales bacterium]
MITHVVMMTFKPGVSDEQIDDLEKSFDALPDKITEIQSYEFGRDIVHSERSYDFALVSVFANLETLRQYAEHPAHLKVVQKLVALCEKIRAVDFEASKLPEIDRSLDPLSDPWNDPRLFKPA